MIQDTRIKLINQTNELKQLLDDKNIRTIKPANIEAHIASLNNLLSTLKEEEEVFNKELEENNKNYTSKYAYNL